MARTGSACRSQPKPDRTGLIRQGAFPLRRPAVRLRIGAAFDAELRRAPGGSSWLKTEPVLGNHEAQATSAFPSETTCSPAVRATTRYFADHGVTDAAGVNGTATTVRPRRLARPGHQTVNCTRSADARPATRRRRGCEPNWRGAPTSARLRTGTSRRGRPQRRRHAERWRPISADLVSGGVELSSWAHFHHYERFADLDATGQPPAPARPGTREIIAGIGGESQGSFTGLTPAPGSQVRLAGYGSWRSRSAADPIRGSTARSEARQRTPAPRRATPDPA